MEALPTPNSPLEKSLEDLLGLTTCELETSQEYFYNCELCDLNFDFKGLRKHIAHHKRAQTHNQNNHRRKNATPTKTVKRITGVPPFTPLAMENIKELEDNLQILRSSPGQRRGQMVESAEIAWARQIQGRNPMPTSSSATKNEGSVSILKLMLQGGSSSRYPWTNFPAPAEVGRSCQLKCSSLKTDASCLDLTTKSRNGHREDTNRRSNPSFHPGSDDCDYLTPEQKHELKSRKLAEIRHRISHLPSILYTLPFHPSSSKGR